MMRPNKVLNLAIATALSVGASSAYAGVLKIHYADGTNPLVQNDYPKFASEFFLNNPSQIAPDCPIANGEVAAITNGDISTITNIGLYAEYTMETVMSENFLAKFELSNGATFGKAISLSDSTLDFKANLSGTSVATTFSSVFGSSGKKGDSVATFLVQAGGGNNVTDKRLLLRFCLQDLDQSLATPGGKVDMTVSIFNPGGSVQVDNNESDHSPTETIATSARGASISLKPATGTVEIDVSKGSLEFVGEVEDTTDPTTARLGTLNIQGTTAGVLKNDLSQWTFVEDEPEPASATLTIIDGNFAASLADPGAVYLDVDKSKTFDSSIDIQAQIDADDPGLATWNLTTENLKALTGQGEIPVLIQADGLTPINDYSEAPQATLVLDYGGSIKDTITSKLRHIKRNGTVCSIYNVPNPTALDIGNIRITNTSTTEAQLIGTLRLGGNTDPALNGIEVFTNQPLLAFNSAGSTVSEVAPNETVRITSELLDGVAKNADWLTAWQANTANNPTGSPNGWPGRAILTVNSNVQSLEVFGLVRNRSGGPLTNMSVGGTGNGCD